MTNFDFEQAQEFKFNSEFYERLRLHLCNLYEVYDTENRKPCEITITITDNEGSNFISTIPDYFILLELSYLFYHKEKEYKEKEYKNKFRAL